MLGMLLIVIGSVGASSGFMLFGIADSMAGGHDLMNQIGIASMVIGTIATAIGIVLYRKREKQLEAALRD